MYPYSNYPNQNPDPNGQGNVPPYTYTENPNYQPPYNYQNGPQGQPPYTYYPPQPPRPYGYGNPGLRAFGIVMLVLFILALVGHHGFFFFPFFPLVIFAVVMLATRGARYRTGWNRPYYRQHYNYWNNPYQSYQYRGRPPYGYDYTQTPPPGGYYGPQQPPSQTQANNQGWPSPKDPGKTTEDMENL